MDNELWINIVKGFLIIVTGVSAGVALLKNNRDKNDRLTRWAWFAFGGLMISAVMSLYLQNLEVSQAKSEADNAEKQARTTASTLNNILDETTKSITYIDIWVGLIIKATALEDAKGRKIIPTRLVNELNEPSKRKSAGDEINLILRKNLTEVRRSILEEFMCGSELTKDKRLVEFFSGDDRITRFIVGVGWVDEEIFDFGKNGNVVASDPTDIICLLTYRSFPNRLSGINKVTDLNGAKWGASLIFNADILTAKFVALDVGQMFLTEKPQKFIMLTTEGSPYASSQGVKGRLEPLLGLVEDLSSGEVKIPPDFF